ncbi:MAG: polysaccharide deacetylase family protein, partial [Pseudomonadota bacterium]
MPDRYPRDLRGHGAHPPDPKWPNDARVVVQFVLNYEEGGEMSVLHGDEASEAFLSEVIGAQNWPGKRHWNMETMYEYGARAGFWRLHRLFTEMKVSLTVFGVTAALARGPAQVEAMVDAGWEMASHGLRWIEYKDYSKADERAHMEEAIRLHTEVVGAPPTGWYTGRCTENTLDLCAEMGLDWAADSYADELPYWHGDTDLLVIPYTLDVNDARFIGAQGFSHGADFYQYLRDSFDTLYEEG